MPDVTRSRVRSPAAASSRKRADRITVRPTALDYQHLLELRTGLRRFLRWSETQARAAGLTPAQHQLLLAIRGHPDPRGPTIGEIADYLVLRHHSAVGLTDRAAAAGLVARNPDHERPATVRLSLTALGSESLDALAGLHMEELARLAPTMEALWHTLAQTRTTPDDVPNAWIG